jgi:hypothetical protein
VLPRVPSANDVHVPCDVIHHQSCDLHRSHHAPWTVCMTVCVRVHGCVTDARHVRLDCHVCTCRVPRVCI